MRVRGEVNAYHFIKHITHARVLVPLLNSSLHKKQQLHIDTKYIFDVGENLFKMSKVGDVYGATLHSYVTEFIIIVHVSLAIF